MKVSELKKYCKERGMKGYSNKTKEELMKVYNEGKQRVKFIDLFCGIGGFHQALKKLSIEIECVLACDIDKNCREVYRENYGVEPVSDIKSIDENNMPDFDLLCAGFPCQPFSNGGNKLSFDDSRGLLFDEIIRIARVKQPKFMFLENVKHILKVSEGRVIEYIKQSIGRIGYTLEMFILSPHTYGIPQQRERVFFVCIRNDLYNGSGITLDDTKLDLKVEDIVDKECDKKYNIQGDVQGTLDVWDELIKEFREGEKISPTILINDAFRTYSSDEFKLLPKWKQDYMVKNKPLLERYDEVVRPWYSKYKELLSKREVYGKLEWQVGLVKKNDSIYNYFIQIRQSGIRVKKSKYFPTLVAIAQIPIYAKYKRYITPRECARLQSFPENFVIHKNDKVSYKQFGNSVNVYNTYTVIKSTLKHYNLFTNSV